MPYIDRNFIDNLVSATDIVDVIGKRVPLKKSGANYMACCPFHEEKTPSFSVNSSKQIFKCFGCDAKGGVLKFIEKYDHLDFTASVEQLAAELNMPIIYEQSNYSSGQSKKLKQQQARKALIQQVSTYYEQQLRNHRLKEKVISYIKSRHISGMVAKQFNLGFAPVDIAELLTKFDKDQYKDLVELGILGKDEEKKHYYGRLKNRLVFPIHNYKGEVVGFGGRALSPNVKPKYWNSPETPIFVKSQELYGLYHLRKYNKNRDYVLVVEGYMDVISLYQHGMTNAVATLGTTTSQAHLNTLSRVVKTIIFCFDGDKAGKTAAWRALKTALPWLKKGVQLKFLFLPEGEDPDTFIQKNGKTTFEHEAEAALSLSNYLFTQLKSKVNFATLEGKAEFVELAIKQLAKIRYELYRDLLVEELVQLSHRPLEKIQQLLNEQSKKHSQQPSTITQQSPSDYSNIPEYNIQISTNTNTATAPQSQQIFALANAIKLVLHYPDIATSKKITKVQLAIIKQSSQGEILGEVLSKIITTIRLTEEIATLDSTELIAPFAKEPCFNQLQTSLATIPLETNAEAALLDCINTLEKINLNQEIKKLVPQAQNDKKTQQKIQKLLKRLTQLKSLKN